MTAGPKGLIAPARYLPAMWLLFLAVAASGLEVTGLVQKEEAIVGPPFRQKVPIRGALVSFISETNPAEVFFDTTDVEGRYRIELEPATGVERGESAKPVAFRLDQNYPNPFNPGTVVSYQLARDVPVRLDIYNSVGQRVRTLVDAWKTAGSHATVWDGRDDSGASLASGVYIYRLEAGDFSDSRKMVLIDGAAPFPKLHATTPDRGAAGEKRPSPMRTDPAGVSDPGMVEGMPRLRGAAAKIARGRTYRVVIDGFKLVPFELSGVVVEAGTQLDFIVAEDRREGVVFLKEGQRQLFLDDFVIEDRNRLRRTMHQPVKKGAVIRPDWHAGVTSLQTRAAPFWDPLDRVFKIWLFTDGLYRTSVDGLHWVIDRDAEAPAGVFFDPLDPDPERRYEAFHPRRLAVSPDGRNWQVVGAQIRSQDEWNFSMDLESHLYIATVKQGGPYGRAVYLSTSKDFKRWSIPELIFHADDLDQELGRRNIAARFADQSLQHPPWNDPRVYNVDAYNMGVFRYESVYIGTPALFHAVGPVPNYPNTVGFHLVQLAVSRNLKDWERVGDRRPFIGPSRRDSGAYDLTQLIGPSNALVRGDELWFYYTGIKYRGGWRYEGTFPHGEIVPLPGYDEDRGAICLAVLRRDGFVSLDADEGEGVLLTRPLIWRGSTLWINAAAAEGEVEVEILDEAGNLWGSGQSRNRSAPVDGDHTRMAVDFGGDLSHLKNQTVRLRFYLRNAEFYSFWTE